MSSRQTACSATLVIASFAQSVAQGYADSVSEAWGARYRAPALKAPTAAAACRRPPRQAGDGAAP